MDRHTICKQQLDFLKNPNYCSILSDTQANIRSQLHSRRELLSEKTGHHCWGWLDKSGRLYNCCLWLLHNQHVHTDPTSWVRIYSEMHHVINIQIALTRRTAYCFRNKHTRLGVKGVSLHTLSSVGLFPRRPGCFAKLFWTTKDFRVIEKCKRQFGWWADRWESKQKTTKHMNMSTGSIEKKNKGSLPTVTFPVLDVRITLHWYLYLGCCFFTYSWNQIDKLY